MNRDIEEFNPSVIVVDPISAFRGPQTEIHATLVRLADICKSKGITAVFTSLSAVGDLMDESERSVSSLMDTWISLQDVEADGERNRVLYLLKSRGMNHSKQLREYRLSDSGVDMTDVYVGPEGVLTGAARLAQEAREEASEKMRQQETERRRREISRRRAAIERQILELRSEIEAEEAEVARINEEEDNRQSSIASNVAAMAKKRGVRA
jgi:circadian clock protein KaiC